VERIRQEKLDIDAELRHLSGPAAASSANYFYERRFVTVSLIWALSWQSLVRWLTADDWWRRLFRVSFRTIIAASAAELSCRFCKRNWHWRRRFLMPKFWVHVIGFKIKLKRKGKKGTLICIVPHRTNPWSAQVRITQLSPCKYTVPPLPRSIHQAAPPLTSGSSRLITAYYSFIDPVRMKGWVGLVSWPTPDGLYPSAAGLVQARESSPVRDRHFTTELHHQRKWWLLASVTSHHLLPKNQFYANLHVDSASVSLFLVKKWKIVKNALVLPSCLYVCSYSADPVSGGRGRGRGGRGTGWGNSEHGESYCCLFCVKVKVNVDLYSASSWEPHL